MDNLVEAITDLVLKELQAGELKATCETAVAELSTAAAVSKKAPVLVAPGDEPLDEEILKAITRAEVWPTLYSWPGYSVDVPPVAFRNWPVESRQRDWKRLLSKYRALVLVGSDLAVLGSIAALGSCRQPPAILAITAVAIGMPVFIEATAFEQVRRFSARLAPGFVGAFEKNFAIVASFGIELGGASSLGSFLARLDRPTAVAKSIANSGSRDVVTAEDIETARRAGHHQILVATGTIVTQLARQKAHECKIEVKFQ